VKHIVETILAVLALVAIVASFAVDQFGFEMSLFSPVKPFFQSASDGLGFKPDDAYQYTPYTTPRIQEAVDFYRYQHTNDVVLVAEMQRALNCYSTCYKIMPVLYDSAAKHNRVLRWLLGAVALCFILFAGVVYCLRSAPPPSPAPAPPLPAPTQPQPPRSRGPKQAKRAKKKAQNIESQPLPPGPP